jgi:hypothetical protein
LALQRIADNVELRSLEAVSLSSTDDTTWTIAGLASLTKDSGIYVLTLSSQASNIRDINATPIESGASVQWVSGAGDANVDGQSNQFDLITILQANRYLAGVPATWSQGDWNGDGVFDQEDVVAALATGNYMRGQYAADPGPLVKPSNTRSDVIDDLFADAGA